MCNTVSGCHFVNSEFLALSLYLRHILIQLMIIAYHDVNGKVSNI